MIFLIINILIALTLDILTYFTLAKRRIIKGDALLKWLKSIHLVFSFITYLLIVIIASNKGEYSDNNNINLMMIMGILIASIWLPRLTIIIFSNLGYYVSRLRSCSGLGKVINNTGKWISFIIIILVVMGSVFGRFNFKYENVKIKYDNLPAELEGFKIVHLSDMHLSSFHNHSKKLSKVIEQINQSNPDIIINTGDFITIGWTEMTPFDSILAKQVSRYGNYAIPGNHDVGTYHPYYNDEDRSIHVNKMDSLLSSAGYIQLKDSSVLLSIDSIRFLIAGVVTGGTIPNITYGDLEKALGDEKGVDFTLMLSHDPNHWYGELVNMDNINLTLSGHTHGMQLGIKIGDWQWSPVSLLYPAWSGLYGGGDNYLYVNRGLGTISFPFRIGMPPEITLITLTSS